MVVLLSDCSPIHLKGAVSITYVHTNDPTQVFANDHVITDAIILTIINSRVMSDKISFYFTVH